MYYCDQRKLAFAFPPRTGSTTFTGLLTSWGANLTTDNKHSKPSDVSIDGFSEYAIYGFYRDPLERFMSLFRFMRYKIFDWEFVTLPMQMKAIDIKNLTDDELLDLFPKYDKLIHYYFDPQVDWLANATLLDFNNYTPEILRVARMFGITEVDVYVKNWTENEGTMPSQKIIDFVRSYYADDYRLWQERAK